MPGTKDHRDRLRASLLIKLLIGQTNTANASTERASLLAKSDAELDRMILSEGGRIETDPAAPSSTQLPPSTELVRSVATLVPTPVKKLAIPGAVADHARRHVTLVSNVKSQTNKSVLNVNLNNVFGDEFRLAIQHQLSKYRSSIEGMAVGVFPPVTPIAPDQVVLFAKLCEAKMWCRVIVNEQVRGRKPRDAVIDRLDAVGVVGKWSQSVLGGLRISRGSDDNLRRRIYGEGRLRYHGSKWEVDELRKLAAWIDDDRNVNIPALAAGMTKDGIKGVWDKIWSYNRRVTETRDGPRIAAA